ncbi:hypothetical protein H0H87_006338 [Tephrocybe sp. NHM501043]|nr:hypothetical protein H0H87_006338 [Tephrocybe sp. NHM501043]
MLFQLVYHRPGKRPLGPESPRQQENGAVEEEKPLSKALQRIRDAVKPEDGSVRVKEIMIHPIKSCRGTSVQSAKYTPLGLENDREWCFVDIEKNFIITAREFPKIVLITPRVEEDPNDLHGGSIVVVFPPDAPEGCKEFRIPLHPSKEELAKWQTMDGLIMFSDRLDGYIGHALPLPTKYDDSTPSTASAISSLYFNKPVHLVYKGPRPRPAEATHTFPNLDANFLFQDGYPLLMMSRESLGELEEEVRGRVGTQGIGEHWREGKVEIRRFRPNVVIEGAGPFAEDAWEEVSFGKKEGPTVQFVIPCIRCLLPNVSPDSGERDSAVPFKVLMKFRTGLVPSNKLGPCVGHYGVFRENGVISVGDVVYVKKLVKPQL